MPQRAPPARSGPPFGREMDVVDVAPGNSCSGNLQTDVSGWPREEPGLAAYESHDSRL